MPESTPMVPLAGDLARQQRSLRLKASATSRRSSSSTCGGESQLPGRCCCTGSACSASRGARRSRRAAPPAPSRRPGSSSGRPSSPSPSSRRASTARPSPRPPRPDRRAGRARRPTSAVLGRLIEQCLLADLPDGTARRRRGARRAHRPRSTTPRALLETVEPLARTCRYGDVRGVDVAEVAHVLRTGRRPGVGRAARRRAPASTTTRAQRCATAIEAAHRGVGAGGRDDLRDPWTGRSGRRSQTRPSTGAVAGRVNRLLLDVGGSTHDEAAARLSRRLSPRCPGAGAAAWLDGFLAGEALLLLHGERAARPSSTSGSPRSRRGVRGPPAARCAARSPATSRAGAPPDRDRTCATWAAAACARSASTTSTSSGRPQPSQPVARLLGLEVAA